MPLFFFLFSSHLNWTVEQYAGVARCSMDRYIAGYNKPICFAKNTHEFPVCVCVCERERESVRESVREIVLYTVRETLFLSACVLDSLSLSLSLSVCVCVCVCVCKIIGFQR